MEIILRCIQCHASISFIRLKNIMYAWWIKSTIRKSLTNLKNCQTSRNSRSRTTL